MSLKFKRSYIITTIILICFVAIGFFVLENIVKVDNTNYIDGVYQNTTFGYHSDIVVEVTIENHKISSVDIQSHEEPEVIANIVFSRLPEQMVKYNTWQVDIISGATYTSRSLIEAVEKSLDKAELENE